MASVKLALFGKTRALEAQIDEFLDIVSQGGMLFEETVRHFADQGADDSFSQRTQQMTEIEKKGDQLVKNVVTALYSEMLIPESRADVLSLLHDIDELLDRYKHTCVAIDIERPAIDDVSEGFVASFYELIGIVVQSVEVLINAARAFFRDFNAVRDHLHKVGFLEGQADKIAELLKREAFRSALPLEKKIHLRHFIEMIDGIADNAEDLADLLEIYTIKRAL